MKKKLIVEEVKTEEVKLVAVPPAKTEKEELLELYEKLQKMGISRISDLENRIANCK